MSHTKQASGLRKYAIVAAVAVVLGLLVLFLLFNPFADQPPRNSGLYPQNGRYKITDIQDATCTLSDPPTCAGKLIISEGDPSRGEAEIDRSTKVRYQTKEIQMYPNDLKEGMVGYITFKPHSAVIETMVVAE